MISTLIGKLVKWILGALFELTGALIVWALKLLIKLLRTLTHLAARHPRSSIAVTVVGFAVGLLGWETIVITVGVLIVAASGWKAAHRDTFDRWLVTFTRTWWRRWWSYARLWSDVMARCGLTVEVGNERHVPELRRVATTPYWDRLTLRMQRGQELDDFRRAAERLRHAFDAQRVTVREIQPNSVGVDLMRRDPFRTVAVPATPLPTRLDDVDYTALPVGITEHLEPFTVSVVGGHLAGAGASGAGKAGLIWGILRALAPAIGAGLVRPIGIDPKGRELRQAIGLFTPGIYGTKHGEGRGAEDPGPAPTGDYAVTCRDTLCLLERLVDELAQRNDVAGEAGERDFEPTEAHPLRLIFIDELAPLLAYWPRSKRDKIEDALGIILTQGRAAGFIVVGEIQEPTKDVFTMRDLFARRIALRLPTEDHVDAALTDNAVRRGARCHEIPESLPGVLYQYLEGAAAFVRARLGHVTDDDIAELVQHVQHAHELARFEARRDDDASDSEAA